MKTFVCNKPNRLRDFTDEVFPQGSFCFAALLRGKDIKVNGVRVNKNVELCAGDTVVYYTTEKQESAASHKAVYEDENILVADKFSGVSAEGLLSELSGRGEFFAVHRLDRNTSGLICFAKTVSAAEELLSAFRGRGVEKTYLAVCKDCFASDCATLTAYALKDERAALVKVYDRPVKGAKTMITEYKILARREGLALAEVRLHTGRTHQIRAHLAHIGCPVLGDGKYGDAALNARNSATRQRLVSKRLCFLSLGHGLEYLNGRVFESAQTLEL